MGFAIQPTTQVHRQCFRRGVASVRHFLQALEAERFQVAVHGRIPQRGTLRFLLQHQPHRGHARAARERRLAGQQFIKHRAQAIDIRARRQTAATFRLLGRDVGRRSEDGECASDPGVALDQLGETEVTEQRLAASIEQHVARLDVAMQDAALMRVMHRARELHHEFSGVANSGPPELLDSIRQRAALRQLHAEEMAAVILPDLVDEDDVWMMKASGGLRFHTEPLDEFRRGEGSHRNDLERDRPVEAALPRPIHQPMPPRAINSPSS